MMTHRVNRRFCLRRHCLVVALLIMGFATQAAAHATHGKLEIGRGWMIEALYDDDEAMSYTETQVFHEPDTMPFQTGRTDKNGRFLFSPDGPGTWRVEVEDDMGHAVILKQEIGNDPGNPKDECVQKPEVSSKGRDNASGLMGGMGIISFVFSVFFWISGRKNRETVNRSAS